MTSLIIALVHWLFSAVVCESRGRWFEQIKGVSMGLQVASLVANIYASLLDEQASANSSFYFRFVDDLFAVAEDENAFCRCLINFDPEFCPCQSTMLGIGGGVQIM